MGFEWTPYIFERIFKSTRKAEEEDLFITCISSVSPMLSAYMRVQAAVCVCLNGWRFKVEVIILNSD